MKKRKQILLAFIFVLIYSFLFLFWWGWMLSVFLFCIFLAILFLPWKTRPKFLLIIKSFYNKLQYKKFKFFIPEKGAKIAVALSGGVDSAVAAHLLQKQGYGVTAFFMRNWDSTINNEYNHILTKEEICQQEEDFKIAQDVADFLKIKLIRIDFIKEYWELVFEKFIKELQTGITPNPDIFCNKFIKFEKFTDYLFNKYPEINYLATGHYGKIKTKKNKKYLFMSNDKIKDQTYFLSEIKGSILNKIFFPLGNLNKQEVRKIAFDANLPNANRKDSVGICFIGKRNFPDFISNYLKEAPGDIVDQATNQIIGQHRGVLFYTIGQRKGLNLGGFQKPYFVSTKDIKNNIVYVSNFDHSELLTKKNIRAVNFNLLVEMGKIWINKEVKFKTRHSEVIYHGRIKEIEGKESMINLMIEAEKPIKFVTPGQEIVLYDQELCLGGGQIQ